MKTYVEFRSPSFPPYEGETAETNPGVFGKRLAEFLAIGLTEKGFRPHEPIAEDWGWVIPIENDGFRLWIGCGCQDGSANGFLCFIEPHQPTLWKYLFFGRIDTTARVASVQKALDEILTTEPSVSEKRWYSHEEFNNPARE